MKLFLDDIRLPPDNTWTLARSVKEAIKVASGTEIDEMSLDHDMGVSYCRPCAFSDVEEPCFKDTERVCDCTCHNTLEPSGMDFLKWVRDNDKWPSKKPSVHSANPVGSVNMRNFIDDFGPYSKARP